MNYYFQYSVIISIATIYFCISWLVPWSELAPNSTISPSYIFDILVIGLSFWALKLKHIVGSIVLKSLIIRLTVVIFFAIVSASLTKSFNLLSPFKYVDLLVIQILILAPFIEEAVFRGAFFSIHERFEKRMLFVIGFNTLLFSFSHFSGTMFLPEEFHSFIYFQMLYTIPLGWLCSKARQKTGGVVEPIILHFGFNLIFYIGVVFFSI
jgi:membrane protease YdiL (CAAX protease family)